MPGSTDVRQQMDTPLPLASFWRRLLAGFVDVVLALLFSVVVGWLGTLSKASALIFLPIMWAVFLLYQASFHALFGATIGKLLSRIRVSRLDGSAIGLKESLRRSSVDILATTHWLYMVVPATLSLPPESFHGQGWGNLFHGLKPTLSPSFEVAEVVMFLWLVAEFVTMLFNRKRRAVHDFLAGTIVVRSVRNAA